MRFLLSILVFAFLLSGCSTAYRSLTDRLGDSVIMSRQGSTAVDTSKKEPARPTTQPTIPEVESLQASYQETSHLDRF